MAPQIEKQQFQNNTDGWVGAVVIGPKGDERGIAVAPGGTVWLSEPEQALTANAPRRAEDNPFIEQTIMRTDPTTGATTEEKVTPLTAISEGRFVPSSIRYIPGNTGGAGDTAAAQAAATAEEPTTPTVLDLGALQRHAEVEQMGEDAQPNQNPPVPRAAAMAAAAAAASDSGAVEPVADPEVVEQTLADEETAAATPAEGEEVGAATPPTGPAPEGEYTAQEEVGTPVGQQTQPAPYTPPQE